ncbi:hypothetical protein F511_21971 [Dorcoceras hygrometricum]|uniref:Nucleic acid-binding proteins superfamily n=1 Tax=Dorcoceras hygrometricum TaxID=472368 RepID=A0A2Z7C9Z6_9LAMI|nr:hypothetical protein F511_21971 [Dorcoceras hygrometricum]
MEIEHSKIFSEEEEDQFLKFIDYAKSMLFPCDRNPAESEEEPTDVPGWSWIVKRILKTCVAYPTGVTPAILLTEVFQAWNEKSRDGAPKRQSECMIKLRRKHKRAKLPNTVTIDSIYEKKFLSLNSVIEAVIVEAFILPGTSVLMLTLGDIWSSNTIDLYLHSRFRNIADSNNGILKEGREILLTGCRLRAALGVARLLPSEYLVVLLDEDEDDDAMLIGAQFCSDTFSSISLDAAKEGANYSLYARIEHIGSLETQGTSVIVQKKQITLVDNDDMRLTFILWGEQTAIAHLLSVGSMLAIDKPFIASSIDSSLDACNDICLEYGSATQLYLVPLIQHKERVCVPLTQSHYQGSRLLSASNLTQGPIVSQVTLPCDTQGSIDFKNYPFRTYVVDLRGKMTGISLYGIVREISGNSESRFSLKIEDATGAIWAKLHFIRSWSLGRLGVGHTVYISGLSTTMTRRKRLELIWDENDTEASVINTSCLLAFLNSSCLHRLSRVSDLSLHMSGAQACRVWIDQIEHCHINTRFMHVPCGHLVDLASDGDLECKFCCVICSAEVQRTFHLKITLADDTAKLFAWCVGRTAAELLQITPDEFYELPDEEQIMYPSALGLEKFIVTVVNCGRQQSRIGLAEQDSDMVDWEVTCAMKCE